MTLRTYEGSCHCGAARYAADLDLAQGTGRCNCRICLKTRQWGAMTKPEAVRVAAGKDALATYEVGGGVGRHRFCRTCGVRLFATGRLEQLGGLRPQRQLVERFGGDGAPLGINRDADGKDQPARASAPRRMTLQKTQESACSGQQTVAYHPARRVRTCSPILSKTIGACLMAAEQPSVRA